MISKKMLDSYKQKNGKIKIAIAGVGYIAKGLVNQIGNSPYIEIVAMASRSKSKIEYLVDKHNLERTLVLDSVFEIPFQDADIIIDLTGDVETGAVIAYDAIAQGKHIVSSAETDATVGPVLAELARNKGVIFTNMWGDEPGLIKGLYDYADVLGLEIMAVGKFKGYHNPYATPESVKPWADKSGQNPVVISSFADGSKMSMEMTVVSNATGLVVDQPGMHLPQGTFEEVNDLLKLTSEGGILSQSGVIEVIKGPQPSGAVYVIVRSKDEDVIDSLKYYKMGDGPNYMLYIPYHMPGIEMLYGIYEMMLLKKAVVEPKGAPVSDVMAIAKRDLREGDILGSIGDFDYTGIITSAKDSTSNNALPIGMAKDAQVVRPVKQGEVIRQTDVIIKNHDKCVELRKRFVEMIEGV